METISSLQAYHLRWNNHQESLLHVFDKLLQSEDFVDVTLCCQGQNIRAHRMVLSACSPFFHDLLREHPGKHPIIILNDVMYEDLSVLMQFMYKGEVDVAAECLESVLHAAHILGIKGLGRKASPSPGRKPALPTPNFVKTVKPSYPQPLKVPLLDQILKESLADTSMSLKRCNITPSMRRILCTERVTEEGSVYPIIPPCNGKPAMCPKRTRYSDESLNDTAEESEASVDADDADDVTSKLKVQIEEDAS
ncbi:unnamed protein product, partial [Notodromas monacha]